MQRLKQTSRVRKEDVSCWNIWVMQWRKKAGIVLVLKQRETAWFQMVMWVFEWKREWEKTRQQRFWPSCLKPFPLALWVSDWFQLKHLKRPTGPLLGSEINIKIALGLFLNWMQSARVASHLFRFKLLISPACTWCQLSFVSITKGFSGSDLLQRQIVKRSLLHKS